MSNVIITLAHPLDAQYAVRLGLPEQDFGPGTDLVVTDDVARGIIGAGYAAVETERPQEVVKALRRHAPKDHPVGLFRKPEGSGGEDAEPDAPAVSAPVNGAAPKRGK